MVDQPIALVTGAAQGLGYACAEALQEDGARVVIADIDAEGARQAAAKLGHGAYAIACDMGKPDQIEAMFDEVEANLGPVTTLVNNAGIAAPGNFLDLPLEQFQAVIDVNLTGVFHSTQRAAKTMVAKGIKGSVVNMSSVNAILTIPTIPAYCASKGGVMQLTKVAALALVEHGIRVNAVGPGAIDTAMMAGVNSSQEAMDRLMSRTPMKRIGTPREVGDVVAFLASDKASYITGETIYIDGGRLTMNLTC